MKLVFFDDFQLGAMTDKGVVNLEPAIADLAPLPPQQRLNAVIADWQQREAAIAKAIAGGAPVAKYRLRAPTPEPTALVCMAVNYMEFGTLPKKPDASAFFKNSRSVIGPDDVMVLPDHPASIFEGEAELALVIGKTTSNVSVEDALDHVFGYVNFVDGSARGLSGGMGLPFFMKGQDTFAPMGPWLVTADEVRDPMDLQVQQWVNGQQTHDYPTSDMAHNVAASVAFVSRNTRLEAGDVIALGCNHQGLHPLQDGDVVEQEADGLGRLRFTVADPLGRTWSPETRAERRENGEKGHSPQLTGKYAK